MQKGLVSIITPCYNTATYVSRLLDSVLMQTYDNIEMFVVDDGSTDGSFDVVNSYTARFEKRGYILSCIRQENAGQSVAIQNALHYVTGEFLVWPDSDDYYASEYSIEKMVKALQEVSAEFAMVRVQEQVIADHTGAILFINGLNRDYEESSSLFEDCLFVRNNFYFCSGGYMVRMSALLETTKLDIFTAKDAGQNWQLLLPVFYKYRCLTIPEVLYTVIDRQASHSRGQFAGYEKTLHKLQVYENTIQGTLDRMQMDPMVRAKYKHDIQIQYLHKKLLWDYSNRNQSAFLSRYEEIKILSSGHVKLADRFLWWGVRTYLFLIPIIRRVLYRIYFCLNRDCN